MGDAAHEDDGTDVDGANNGLEDFKRFIGSWERAQEFDVWDGVHGEELEGHLVQESRATEIGFFKNMGVYAMAPLTECRQQ